MTIDARGTVASISEFLDLLKAINAGVGGPPVWFRGHERSDYTLLGSAYRPHENLAQYEGPMLKRFMQDANSMLSIEVRDNWEWLFLAQHNGVPTRLLDWSENALVALYFACADGASGDLLRDDGDVWIIVPSGMNSVENSWSAGHPSDLPMLGVDQVLDEYHPFATVPTGRALRPVAALAGRRFDRIRSQRGTFTIAPPGIDALEALAGAEAFLFRIAVAASAKDAIVDELTYLGIEERVVYPDLHRLGSTTKAMFK